MNNLKKIGLTALAGSLVAVSASAVEMSVSGTAEVTYTSVGGKGTGTSSASGNPFGSNTSLSFSGEGDVGFGTAKIVRTIGDNMNDNSTTAANEFLSAWQTVDAGDLGVFMFDSTGGAISGLRANRDMLPTAYEEVWTGVSSHGLNSAGSDNVMGYRNSFGPITLDAAYKKGSSVGGTGDGVAGGAGSTGTTTDYHATVDMGGLLGALDGLVLRGGYSDHSSNKAVVAGQISHDVNTFLAHANYSMGPVSVGYRFAESNNGGKGTNDTVLDAYAVAFNVNDNMTISYAQQDREFDVPGGTNVTEDSSAINAAYTVGAASVRATIADSSNAAGVTANDDEHMELSLVLSF